MEKYNTGEEYNNGKEGRLEYLLSRSQVDFRIVVLPTGGHHLTTIIAMIKIITAIIIIFMGKETDCKRER